MSIDTITSTETDTSTAKTLINSLESGSLILRGLVEGTGITLSLMESSVDNSENSIVISIDSSYQISKWYSTNNLPSNAIGNNNDMYLNTLLGDVYQKQNNIWVLQENIIGPKGDNGSDGKGIYSAIINASGHLIIRYTDNSTYDAGNVIGSSGIVAISSVGTGENIVYSYNSSSYELKTKAITAGTGIAVSTSTDGSLVISNTRTTSSGSSTFIGLSDVPVSFIGSSNKFVKANSGETSLVFSEVTSSDISGLATIATTGSYVDLDNKPSFSTVATSGSYLDLTNKPDIPITLQQLNNVDFNSLSNGQVLTYSNGLWINTAISPSFNEQVANTIFAGPITGSVNSPAFRTLVSNDIPFIPASKINSSTLDIQYGGTGTDLSTSDDNSILIKSGSLLTSINPPSNNTILNYNNGFYWDTKNYRFKVIFSDNSLNSIEDVPNGWTVNINTSSIDITTNISNRYLIGISCYGQKDITNSNTYNWNFSQLTNISCDIVNTTIFSIPVTLPNDLNTVSSGISYINMSFN